MGCIQTISAGESLLSGIPVGKLPRSVFIKRCHGLWMAIRIRGGRLQSLPVQARFIPRFKARNKPFAIPDARVAISTGPIGEAWLIRPTRRYDHAVLGDAIEAGGLAVANSRGRRIIYELDKDSVFEDRMARLVDLDGDGTPEIVTVHSYPDSGAALAVYGLKNDELIVRLAQTRAIGHPHRWLNPLAAADFDGDGRIEIAWVETPHIGGVLKVARLYGHGENRALEPFAELAGFSNHARGSRELFGGTTFDWNGDGRPDLILPSADRKRIRVVAFESGKLKAIDEMEIGGEIDSPLVAADFNGDGRGELLLVTRKGELLSFAPSSAGKKRGKAGMGGCNLQVNIYMLVLRQTCEAARLLNPSLALNAAANAKLARYGGYVVRRPGGYLSETVNSQTIELQFQIGADAVNDLEIILSCRAARP
jgi:hypothetical protein